MAIKFTDPVEVAFLQDYTTQVQYLEGVLGVGKSYKLAMKAYLLATNREPDDNGHREVTIAIVRLDRNAIIKGIFTDCKEFYVGMLKLKNVTTRIAPDVVMTIPNMRLPDGTTATLNLTFMGLDHENTQKKLHGIGFTAVFFDEIDLINKPIYDKALERAGRRGTTSTRGNDRKYRIVYTHTDDTGVDTIRADTVAEIQLPKWNKGEIISKEKLFYEYNNWEGLVLVANPPSRTNWVYKEFIASRLKDTDGNNISTYYRLPTVYIRCKEDHKPTTSQMQGRPYTYDFTKDGYDYYVDDTHYAKDFNSKGLNYWRDLIQSKPTSETLKNILGYHLSAKNKQPVFIDSYDREKHIQYNLSYNKYSTLILSFDHGRNPACIAGQLNAWNGVDIIGQMYRNKERTNSIEFINTDVKDYLISIYCRELSVVVIGDPTGFNINGLTGTNYFYHIEILLQELNIPYNIMPKKFSTYKPQPLIEATELLLERQRGVQIDSRLTYIHKGLDSEYVYDKKGVVPDKTDDVTTGENYSHVIDCMLQLTYHIYTQPEVIQELISGCEVKTMRNYTSIDALEDIKHNKISNLMNNGGIINYLDQMD